MLSRAPVVNPVSLGTLGALLDGATDDSNVISNALAAGVSPLIPPGKICVVAQTIQGANDAEVLIHANGQLKWAGANHGTLYTGGVNNPLINAGISGFDGMGKINPGVGGGRVDFIFDLHSPQDCRFRDLDILTGNAVSAGMRITADSVYATGWEATRNAVFNDIGHIRATTIGKGLVLDGGALGGVVTLNHFDELEFQGVQLIGVEIVKNVDNNFFIGYHRYELTASNAIGLLVNSGNPAVESNVYSNQWDDLAVDTFVGANAGRQGVVLNHSRFTIIRYLHQDPPAEGGPIVDNYALSYDIWADTAAPGKKNGAIEHWTKNIEQMSGYTNNPIRSGALPSPGAFTSGVGQQISAARDVRLLIPITYSPTAGAFASCAVALSPDNVTYTVVGSEVVPLGTVNANDARILSVYVPAGWYVRLVVTNAAIGAGNYY